MEKPIETIDYRGYKIQIFHDFDPMNPRQDWDNIGTMVCFHKRYTLGDNIDFPGSENFSTWEDVYNYIQHVYNPIVCYPLFLYDHTGLRIKIGSFHGFLPEGHAHFDSGQVGFIFATRENVKKMLIWQRITKKRKEKITEYIEYEVDVYNQYLSGAVYGYNIDGINSCFGFFGYDFEKSGLLDDAKSAIDWHIKAKIHDHLEQVKSWIKNSVPLQYRKPLEL